MAGLPERGHWAAAMDREAASRCANKPHVVQCMSKYLYAIDSIAEFPMTKAEADGSPWSISCWTPFSVRAAPR